MSKATPTEAEIMEAIRASGYLMEQEVATLLEGMSFDVETNVPFEDSDRSIPREEDSDQSVSREYDVGAWKTLVQDDKRNFSVVAELICECKNKSAPLVFIGRKKAQSDKIHVPGEYIFPWNDYRVETTSPEGNPATLLGASAFEYFELAKSHYYFQKEYKAVQFCHITGNPKKWEANHKGIYNSLFYPLIKAMRYRQSYVRRMMASPATDWTTVWLFFPIVVLSDEMYYIDSMADFPSPVKKEHITFTRSLESKSIFGKFMVEFVTLKGLPYFINCCFNPFVEKIANLAKRSPEAFLPNKREA